MKNFIPAVLSAVFIVVLVGGVYLYMNKLDVEKQVFQTLPEPTVTVTRTAEGYEPKEITIKKGEVVLWKNESTEYHWPASDLHPTHTIYSDFDPLKPVASGADWAFQFNKVGIWKYHDHIRANKVGTVIVVE
jgi:plastocyanin